MRGRLPLAAAAVGVAIAFLGMEARQAEGQPVSPVFESVGPNSFGGRTRSLIVVKGRPGSPEVLLAGSIGGGLWRSRNAGESWESVPELRQQSVTSLVASPVAPLTLYVGTGEIDQRLRGGGIFRSLNGGESWTKLPGTEIDELAFIRRLSVSADGAQILAATSEGLFESSTTTFSFRCALPAPWGCGEPMSDVISHPRDPAKAVAASAETAAVFYREGLVGAAPEWRESRAETGTDPPADTVTWRAWEGSVSLAYASANPDIVYAAVIGAETDRPIWRSENGGQLFKPRDADLVPCVPHGKLVERTPGWANLIWAGHPTNPDLVVLGRIDLWRSTDGGTSLTIISDFDKHPLSPHADHHVLATGPDFGTHASDPFRAWIGTDGGVFYTGNLTAAASPCEPVSWTERNTGYSAVEPYSGTALSDGTLLLATQDLGLLRRSPTGCGATGSCWTAGHILKPPSPSTPVRDDGFVVLAYPADPKVAFALGNGFDVLRTMNSGHSWEYISDNQWNGTAWNRVSGEYWPITEAGLSRPAFAIDSSQPPQLYLGGGCLYQGFDVLEPIISSSRPRWYRMEAPLRKRSCDTWPYISAIVTHPRVADDLWLCYGDGRIFRTTQALSGKPSWHAVRGGPESIRGRSCQSLEVLSSGELLVAFSGTEQPNVYRVEERPRGSSTYFWAPIKHSEGLVYQATSHPRNNQRIFVATERGVLETCASCTGPWPTLPGTPSQRIEALFWHDDHLYVGTYGGGIFAGRVP